MLRNMTLDKIKKYAAEGKSFKETLETLSNDTADGVQRDGIKLSAELAYMKQQNEQNDGGAANE